MKKTILLPALFLLAVLATLSAQTPAPPDTIRAKGFKLYLGDERVKDAGKLDRLMLGLNDPKINRSLKTEKTFDAFYWVTAVGGAVLMGVGGYNSINGKLNNGKLYIGGGILTLGSGVFGIIGAKHRKDAYRRYNDVVLGRGNTPRPAEPPMPSVLRPEPVAAPAPPSPAEAEQNAAVRKTEDRPRPAATPSGAYIGFSTGLGWTKQHINYEFVFIDGFETAHAFSHGIQYGNQFSDRLGWQLELGLSQHGFRQNKIYTSGGVKVNAKADGRIRYLEVPFSLTYRVPLGKKGFELAALPGVSLGYAVSGKVVARGTGESETRKVRLKITEKVSLKDAGFGDRLDAALLLGAQAAYPFGPGKAVFEVRYHLGILNLDRNKDFDFTEAGDKAFNRTLTLRVGYRYAL